VVRDALDGVLRINSSPGKRNRRGRDPPGPRAAGRLSSTPAARRVSPQVLCLESRMIAQKLGRSYPGSFSASTSAFIVPNVVSGL
jgi:hypothetical protein